MAVKVYLSPSSQNGNPYSAQGTNEQRQCNRIAEAAKIALERNGYIVKKAPEGQGYVENVAESNAWGADIHMPIHTNAGGNSKGTMGLCYPGYVGNKYMQGVYNAVADVTPWNDVGIVTRQDLYEINTTNCMCVYMEMAFHDKTDSAQWIIDNVVALGEAIAKGMCAADGKKYVGGKDKEPWQIPGAAVNDAGLYYQGHSQTTGWLTKVHDGQTSGTTGHGKRLEAIKIDPSRISGLVLNVKAHIQGIGWKLYENITKDTVIGTVGQSKRLEAIEIEAIGLPEGKKLMYRVHVEKEGWTGWVEATFTTGSTGIRKRIEAIQIMIVDA